MEEPIGEYGGLSHGSFGLQGLNPCFSGRTYRRSMSRTEPNTISGVLILVLVEEPIGVNIYEILKKNYIVLILVLVEEPIGADGSVVVENVTIVVLILVLVEEPIGERNSFLFDTLEVS